jgi:hypothetical protein
LEKFAEYCFYAARGKFSPATGNKKSGPVASSNLAAPNTAAPYPQAANIISGIITAQLCTNKTKVPFLSCRVYNTEDTRSVCSHSCKADGPSASCIHTPHTFKSNSRRRRLKRFARCRRSSASWQHRRRSAFSRREASLVSRSRVCADFPRLGQSQEISTARARLRRVSPPPRFDRQSSQPFQAPGLSRLRGRAVRSDYLFKNVASAPLPVFATYFLLCPVATGVAANDGGHRSFLPAWRPPLPSHVLCAAGRAFSRSSWSGVGATFHEKSNRRHGRFYDRRQNHTIDGRIMYY